MIRSFHDLRRDEEGQALVLAAICMLILTLCVLATVNITFAAKEKIRLQNSADAAAYTTAAYEARTMNFLAYTNRAMICQYNSQMNLMALTSYFIFTEAVAYMLYQALAAIPYIGTIFYVIYIIYAVIAWAFFLVAMVMVPLIDGVNYGMSLAQAAVISSVTSKIATGASSEVAQYNPSYQVTNLSASLLGDPDSFRWGATGNMVALDPRPTMIPITAGQGAYDRLLMVEMVNAARHKFTAYGGPNGGTLLSWLVPPKIPRQVQFTIGIGGFFGLTIGKMGRTEWGALAPGASTSGILGSIGTFLGLTPTEEIYSLDRFQLKITIVGWSFGFNLDSFAYADRGTLLNAIGSLFGVNQPSHDVSIKEIDDGSIPWYLAWIKPIVKPIINQIVAAGNRFVGGGFFPPKWLPLFHFGMMPYAKFRASPRVGVPPSATQLFNQPPVLTMVTAPTNALMATGKPFLGNFGFKLGAISSAGSPPDRAYNTSRNKLPSKRGFVDKVNFRPGDTPLPFMNEGFHAVSAAMAYYHRPGDWQEPPNLFNPMWGAKLMPVVDYPSLVSSFTPLAPLFTNNMIVH